MSLFSIDPTHDYVADLNPGEVRFPMIARARSNASKVRQLLLETFQDYSSADADLVVFGSLARGEWTSGSDVDWTLLIDGQANPEHREIARQIERRLQTLTFDGSVIQAPGSEGIFGNMAFSHELVHHIGGQPDSNRNLTQRILLLLEATCIRAVGNELSPFDRVSRQVLRRYLARDVQDPTRIPRFLLNDIVRYWRTVCVDFAYKDWEQAGRKWALRNIKLRMSRKLLFLTGLLTVFSCHEQSAESAEDFASNNSHRIQDQLMAYVRSTPLDILVSTLERLGLQQPCLRILKLYDEFLRSINDRALRQELSALIDEQAHRNPSFVRLRDLSHEFQAELHGICFREETDLQRFIIDYGVF